MGFILNLKFISLLLSSCIKVFKKVLTLLNSEENNVIQKTIKGMGAGEVSPALISLIVTLVVYAL